MNATTLFQIGMLHAACSAWTITTFEVSPNQAGASDPLPRWDFDDWERQFPQARGVVFVEPAAHGLAEAIADASTDDPLAWLASWRAGAQQVLRLSQRHPARWLLVDATEARAHPHALDEAYRERFGADLPMPRFAHPTGRSIDPLCLVVSAAMCHADGDAQSLLAELETSCVALAADAPVILSAGRGLDIDGVAAVRRLHALRTAVPQAPTEPMVPAERADALRRDLLCASDEAELLLLQISQLHEELQDRAEQCRTLESRLASAVSAGNLMSLSIADLRVVAERNVPPYRELSFALGPVQIGSRTVPQAAIRLVEHNGYPGLVVFADAQGGQLTESWQEMGREYGVPYALLIPSYPPSQPIFDAMRSADWTLLNGLLARIETHLGAQPMPSAPRWSRLARRLREQLLEMPMRLRYESLNINLVAEAVSPTLSFRFSQVMCGARELHRLTLHWRPHGARAGLDILCDADSDRSPPMPLWPDDAPGLTPDRISLPLGPADRDDGLHDPQPRDTQPRDDWPRLTAADRAFIAALMAAWPEIVRQVPSALRQEPGLADLTDAAAAMLRLMPPSL